MPNSALIAGVDEAGRGPLAGPVVAAAVILDTKPINNLGDSKTKSESVRERLYTEITAQAQAIGVGQASAGEIDELNIHHASLLAMQRAVRNLGVEPEQALVDGKFCPQLDCPCEAIVGGDGLVAAISAASIIAKVTRDRIMLELDQQLPAYGFSQHKGYPTRRHLEALEVAGVSSEHRRSFAPVRRLLEA